MSIDVLTLSAALLSGLLGGVHCAAMCGGIATGFSVWSPRHGLPSSLQLNTGRVLGYALAGALVGGMGDGVLRLFEWHGLMLVMRMAMGVVLVLVALRLLDHQGRLRFLARPGMHVWRWLRPLQKRVLPANTASRRLLAGMVWGWMPCGLSTTMLAAAWLASSTVGGALIMTVFGLGTWLVMVPLTWSGARVGRWMQREGARRGAAALVLFAGVVTMAGPWLMQVPSLHGVMGWLGCGLR
ncbi:sulfite exporter TauE/SafE family protein [Dyella sp. C11]|uniref:sulfite exporter TauE/SafE family protein n=1 Tax=Dyella sp. C11 TaxID=2126991 RepID=UPI000D65AAB9|nr:sulfite exporter TauE/SafE family protein [Dyella sp. C11]